MPTMTKRVNVRATVAVRTINPPIYGTCNNIIMTTGDILKCLCKRAIVEEILPDGSTIRLNMKNYYTDNGAGLDAILEKENNSKIAKAKEEPVVSVPKVDENVTVDNNPDSDQTVDEQSSEDTDTMKSEVTEEVKNVLETEIQKQEETADETTVTDTTTDEINTDNGTVEETPTSTKKKNNNRKNYSNNKR